MDQATLDSSARLAIGLLASAGIGVMMATNVDIIGTPLAIMVVVLTVVSGLLSTRVLLAAAPRHEAPSRWGSVALIIFLAIYVVVGKVFWTETTLIEFVIYLVAGAAYIWLTFTSVAETHLLSALAVGGFSSYLLGVVGLKVIPVFSSLTGLITTQAETTTVYTSIACICAIPGSFAAITARMSDWGMGGNKQKVSWHFTENGRLQMADKVNK